jgi:hypothetical protein
MKIISDEKYNRLLEFEKELKEKKQQEKELREKEINEEREKILSLPKLPELLTCFTCKKRSYNEKLFKHFQEHTFWEEIERVICTDCLKSKTFLEKTIEDSVASKLDEIKNILLDN